MTLKTQPSKMPTRKMWAVIVTGAVVGAATEALNTFVPGTNWQPFVEANSQYITALLMALAGYITKDAA